VLGASGYFLDPLDKPEEDGKSRPRKAEKGVREKPPLTLVSLGFSSSRPLSLVSLGSPDQVEEQACT